MVTFAESLNSMKRRLKRMKVKKSRSMKVYGQSGYRYKETPTIMLKGQWLRELGFDIGDYISVSCEDGKLIITPDAGRIQFVAER